ncbi:MAG TPA: chitobiase/beta-hexosaminidase C-terminal domain-containing protein [archaeon]|nr:chitobiase/beta-hexosaminidase C-terminal domain-containing protein [archaeon]
MKRNIYLLLLISLILFVSVVYAKESTVEESQIEEGNLDFYKYPDVFYPPEEELAKQGMTLESYKQALKRSAPKNRNSSVNNIWGTCPTTGTVKIPVLLVKFSDKNITTYNLSDINNYFNSQDINSNFISVSKYYNMQSYGTLNFVFDVYDWTTMPQTFAYYSANNVTEYQLPIDAYTTFNPSVDFAQYDNDNDGRIDGAVIIYPDIGKTTSLGIWPQTRILKADFDYLFDNKYLGNTSLVSERKSDTSNYFATVIAIHELAHILGLPDLYSLNPQGTFDEGPIYQMSMMIFKDYTSTTNHCLNKPINLDVWSRYFLGWITPKELNTFDDKNQTLRSVNYYPDAVILKNNNLLDREYFIIENRQRDSNVSNLDKCLFSNSSPYNIGGFAIYHVDENKIEAHYPNINGNVNWDPDGNYYDDTTRPGITYEKNYVTSLNSFTIQVADLYYYQNTLPGIREYFDENHHLRPGYTTFDMTTKSYSGNPNPLIRFQAWSGPTDNIKTATILIAEDTITPIIDYNSGTYPEGTEFVISTTTPDSIIYYTTDGSTPNFNSPQIESGSAITLPVGTITLKAMAKGEDYYKSEIITRTYTITGTVANPQATPASGFVDYGTQVSLSTTTDGATIRYILDGSEPTESSSIYSSPITITQDTIIKARAFKENWQPSDIVEFNYTVNVVVAPVASQESGVLDFRTPVTLSTTTTGATIRYTIDGTEPTATSPIYTYPIYVVRPITLKAKTFKTGQEPSDTSSYDYQVKLSNPKFNIDSGNYPFTTKIILTSDVPGVQIYYTTDGSDPNDGQLYTAPLRLLEDTQLRVISKRIDYVDSDIIQKDYSISHQEQQVPTLLINPRTPRAYENFDITYITERHWEDDINFSINNMNGCTFNLRHPLLYNDGHYSYYIFENNRCIRRQQRRLTFVASNQNDLERVDTEITILDSGITAIAVGRE